MGRIRSNIDINGRECWTLFDTGARNSYITRGAAERLDVKDLSVQRSAQLGGRKHDVTQICLLFADVEGHPLEFQANVVDEIGNDEDDRVIDVLFGAIAMQLWGIRLDPQNERLDFTHFATEFVEY